MSRAFVIAILSSGFLAVFAFAPPVIEPIFGPEFSNSAHAINLNSSRSNIYQMGGGPGKKAATTKAGKGTPTGTTNRSINLNSSRSNNY